MAIRNDEEELNLFKSLGAHQETVAGQIVTRFAVWAPNAKQVAVIGDFNHWNADNYALTRDHNTGIWHGSFSDITDGALYKYQITATDGTVLPAKADPFAFVMEPPPGTASILHDLALSPWSWHDQHWMSERKNANSRDKPISIYELHL